MAYAKSADPDQTAPEGAVWSGSTLFAVLEANTSCFEYSSLVVYLWTQTFAF